MAYLGIDIGGQFAKMSLVGARGDILARARVPTNATQGPEALFADIASKLPDLVGRRNLQGAGVGCAGLIDRRNGRVLESPNLPTWRNAPIRRIARRALGVQTLVDNDANSAAFGEYRAGVGRGTKLLVLITLGTGVGGGIVWNGQVVRGASNFAGEIGHMSVSQKGPKCKCGNRGCLEAYIGAYALVRDAHRRLRGGGGRVLRQHMAAGETLTPKLLARAARAGDAVAAAVFANAAQQLGIGLASIVNILNPDMIAIGGGVSAEFSLLAPIAKRVVYDRAFGPSRKAVKIVRAKLGNDSATVGAALMMRDMEKQSIRL